MKKLIILCGILLATGMQAQFTVTDHEGAPILDGSVYTFTSTAIDQASMGFLVHNNSAANITMKIQCEDITNATGAGMELCFGDFCLSSVSEGYAYPPGPAVTIAPGGTNSQYDHFFNTYQGDGTNYPIDYVFRFFQMDSEGDEIGTPLTMTYRYTGTLATTGFELANMGVALQSNLMNDQLHIRTSKNVQIQMFDINGKFIGNHNLSTGDQSIDVSSLSAGIYIANFSNEEGQKSSAKLIKK